MPFALRGRRRGPTADTGFPGLWGWRLRQSLRPSQRVLRRAVGLVVAGDDAAAAAAAQDGLGGAGHRGAGRAKLVLAGDAGAGVLLSHGGLPPELGFAGR